MVQTSLQVRGSEARLRELPVVESHARTRTSSARVLRTFTATFRPRARRSDVNRRTLSLSYEPIDVDRVDHYRKMVRRGVPSAR